MNINQMLTHLKAKSTSSKGSEVSSEQVSPEMFEALKTDPNGFSQLLEGMSEGVVDESAGDSGEAKSEVKVLSKSFENVDVEKLLQMAHEEVALDTKQPNQELVVKENSKNIIQPSLMMSTKETQQNVRNQAINEHLLSKLEGIPSEGQALDSNLSVEEVEDIQSILAKKETKSLNTKNIKNPELLKTLSKDQVSKSENVEQVLADKNSTVHKASPKEILEHGGNRFLELKEQAGLKKNSPNFSNIKKFSVGVDKPVIQNVKQESVEEAKLNIDTKSTPIKSQGAELNLVKPQASVQNLGTQGAQKTFQMDQMTTSNREAIISKVSDYIVQNSVRNTPRVEMNFNHHELGDIGLVVEKALGNNVNVTINPTTTEGMKFFSQHQTAIMTSLAQSGVNIGEFKLDGQSTSSQQFSQQGQESSSDFLSQQQKGQGQREQDSKRRQELWNQFQNREAA